MPGFNGGGRNTPSSTLGGKDVHRAHRWRIEQIVGISPSEFVYAKELTLPEVGFDEESVPGASVDYKFPKKATFGDVTIVFYDYYNLYDRLDELYKKVWTPDGGMSAANAYMAKSSFSQMTGSGAPYNRFVLINSWIKNISHSPLTYESPEIKTVSVTLAYTWSNYVPR